MLAILALPTLCLCGCGTIVSLHKPFNEPIGAYGGVQVDTWLGLEMCPSFFSLLCVADMPVSFVADTILLPLTLFAEKENRTREVLKLGKESREKGLTVEGMEQQRRDLLQPGGPDSTTPPTN